MLTSIHDSMLARTLPISFAERQLNGIYDFASFVGYVSGVSPDELSPSLDVSGYAGHLDVARALVEQTMAEVVATEDWFGSHTLDTLSPELYVRLFDLIACADRLVTLAALGVADASVLRLVGDVASVICLVGTLADEGARKDLFESGELAHDVARTLECGLGPFWVEWAHNLAACARWATGQADVDAAFDAAMARGRARVAAALGISDADAIFSLLEASFAELSAMSRDVAEAKAGGALLLDAPESVLHADTAAAALPALARRKVGEVSPWAVGTWCADMHVTLAEALWL